LPGGRPLPSGDGRAPSPAYTYREHDDPLPDHATDVCSEIAFLMPGEASVG